MRKERGKNIPSPLNKEMETFSVDDFEVNSPDNDKLHQGLSNFSAQQIHLKGLLKHKFLDQ